MSLVQRLLIHLTQGRRAQERLWRWIGKARALTGIGSGRGVESSGEDGVFKLVREQNTAPLCIFDIGSNQGQYLALTQQAFRETQLVVHCFEPGATTFQFLTKNQRVNPQHQVTLNNCALGRSEGEAELFYDQPGSGLASLTKRNLYHARIPFDQSERVRIDTVDNYCRRQIIHCIDLLKLDVEGHELDVLAGAAEMLQKRAVKIVTFEFGGCNIDTRTFFRDYFDFFAAQNMRIFRVTPGGYLHEITIYYETLEQFDNTNYVAMKAE